METVDGRQTGSQPCLNVQTPSLTPPLRSHRQPQGELGEFVAHFHYIHTLLSSSDFTSIENKLPQLPLGVLKTFSESGLQKGEFEKSNSPNSPNSPFFGLFHPHMASFSASRAEKSPSSSPAGRSCPSEGEFAFSNSPSFSMGVRPR